jgi:hypothetical protein
MNPIYGCRCLSSRFQAEVVQAGTKYVGFAVIFAPLSANGTASMKAPQDAPNRDSISRS